MILHRLSRLTVTDNAFGDDCEGEGEPVSSSFRDLRRGAKILTRCADREEVGTKTADEPPAKREEGVSRRSLCGARRPLT